MQLYSILPNYSGYRVYRDGKIYSLRSNTWLKPHVNGAGYLFVNLTSDEGVRSTQSIHRLLATAFVYHRDIDITSMYVNHKDGDKMNNNVSNLEWVSPRENQEHAGKHGLTKKCIPVLMRNFRTGEVVEFPSAFRCGQAIGLSKDAVLYRIKSKGQTLYPDGYQFKAVSDTSPWNVCSTRVYDPKRFGGIKPILVKCLRTGKIKEYPTITSAALELKVSIGAISIWLQQPNKMTPTMHLLKELGDETPWPIIPDPYFELTRISSKKPVVKTCINTGNVVVYLSLSEAAVRMGVGKTTLSYQLQFPEKVWNGLYKVKYY